MTQRRSAPVERGAHARGDVSGCGPSTSTASGRSGSTGTGEHAFVIADCERLFVKWTRPEAFSERKAASNAREAELYEVLAALLLVLGNEGRRVGAEMIGRVGEILDRWNDDHRWLTGTDDYPMAAVHALRDEPVDEMSVRVEAIYRGLHREGLRRGNPLQLASHLLAISPRRSPAL